MSFGLIPVLSNVEIAHQYYAAKNSDVCLFDSPEELASVVKQLYEFKKRNYSGKYDWICEEVFNRRGFGKYLLINKSLNYVWR